MVRALAKGCLEDSDATDAETQNFRNIINGGDELWEKHNGCLAPIMAEIEYDLERHVKKYGPTTEDTVLRMLILPHRLLNQEA